MNSIQETLKLKRAPTDIWSTREQLYLASSVLKSGDQNWVSVSRSLKPIADKDSNRPSDWFSQKSCAQQYAHLLENANIPKRKKRESGETTSESIVRRLTQDRIAELAKTLSSQREEYQQLKNEVCLLKNGTISYEKLQKTWHAIEQEEKESEQKNKTQLNVSVKPSKNEDFQLIPASAVQNTPKKANDFLTVPEDASKSNTDGENRKNDNREPSLLTSLLKSPNSAVQSQAHMQSTHSPTIASLLCSSPKVPVSTNTVNASPQLNQPVSNTTLNTVREQPSVSAPTLSMLLEQSSTNIQKSVQQPIQDSSINSKNLQSPTQMQSIIKTRSAKLAQENITQTAQVPQSIPNQITNVEPLKITQNLGDGAKPEAVPMNKDEINQIIGDIEEIIKEEIKAGPPILDTALSKIVSLDDLSLPPSVPAAERSEPRNVDESASLSNSPTSEISIEEIDSSTSNIAEIIGTAIETIKCKVDNSHSSDIQEQEKTSTADNAEKSTKDQCITQNTQVTQKTTEHSEKPIDDNLSLVSTKDQINVINDEKQVSEKKDTFDENPMDTDENLSNKCSSNDQLDNEMKDCSDDINATENDGKVTDEKKDLPTRNTEINQTENTPVTEKPGSPDVVDKKQEKESITDNKAESHKTLVGTDTDCSADNTKKKADEATKDNVVFKESEVQECSKASNDTPEDRGEDKKENVSIDMEFSENLTADNSSTLKKDDSTITQQNIESIKQEEGQEATVVEKVEENNYLNEYDSTKVIKIEKCDDEEAINEEIQPEKGTSKKITEIKQENSELSKSTHEIDDEEPTITKVAGGRAMKTYSKKQNASIDSEIENEPNWETADYRAWKKSIMLVYHRLSTNKYASIFFKPITEDQAPGYHSIIYKPMDLSTIKKNIDNGTIRSTPHFQRDVMLMFQNAIMFNKHNTFVHKMTLEMQEECLQHMQILAHAAGGEASFRRETRTAANVSNDTSEVGSKRKWSHANYSPHEMESHRMKKRRKSEND